jgi:hypothetical protein
MEEIANAKREARLARKALRKKGINGASSCTLTVMVMKYRYSTDESYLDTTLLH